MDQLTNFYDQALRPGGAPPPEPAAPEPLEEPTYAPAPVVEAPQADFVNLTDNYGCLDGFMVEIPDDVTLAIKKLVAQQIVKSFQNAAEKWEARY